MEVVQQFHQSPNYSQQQEFDEDMDMDNNNIIIIPVDSETIGSQSVSFQEKQGNISMVEDIVNNAARTIVNVVMEQEFANTRKEIMDRNIAILCIDRETTEKDILGQLDVAQHVHDASDAQYADAHKRKDSQQSSGGGRKSSKRNKSSKRGAAAPPISTSTDHSPQTVTSELDVAPTQEEHVPTSNLNTTVTLENPETSTNNPHVDNNSLDTQLPLHGSPSSGRIPVSLHRALGRSNDDNMRLIFHLQMTTRSINLQRHFFLFFTICS